MNILIVGNGFDLSHYLPTKYDHFMDVMKAVESKETGKKIANLSIHTVGEWMRLIEQIFEKRTGVEQPNYDMNFNELFSCIRDKWFIDKTEELYLTEQINISSQDVLKLQYRLELNDWYQYFKNHVREVKTWIDFEIKISEALKVVANFLVQLEIAMDEFGSFSTEICFYGERKKRQIFLTREYCNILELFKILQSGYFIDQEDCDENGCIINIPFNVGDPDVGDLRFYINNSYILLQAGFLKIKNDQILSGLYKQLSEFIEIFNIYLDLIVNEFKPKSQLQIEVKEWVDPDLIYSFNYTKTYSRLYDSVNIEYLHGSHGEYQNIVLGISDLEHENLKKLKAYGFTKYHQKLLKNTDYKFLNEDSIVGRKINGYKNTLGRRDIINILIWGHSLDSSDKEYINEIFDLNSEGWINVKIFYFNETAKFDLLANLLHILGKEKVEFWMKKGWLKFEPNPDIVEINNIQPVDLPKFEK